DGLDDGPDLVPAADVEPLERALRPCPGRHRNEVAPELRNEEGPVQPVVDAEPARVAPVEVAAVPEDRLHPGVVALLLEAEAHWAEVPAPVVAPAGQRA